jgi:hypothetical protein
MIEVLGYFDLSSFEGTDMGFFLVLSATDCGGSAYFFGFY